jgi:hypothetical protein
MLFIKLASIHTAKSKAESNAIKVDISHWKSTKAVILSLTGVKHEPTPDFPTHFQYMPIGSPSQNITLEEMPRLNTKKVTATAFALKDQISRRSGAYWDMIQAFANAHGMTIKEKEEKAAA